MSKDQEERVFSMGDCVRLKSGGPLMTIERRYDDDTVHCVYYTGVDYDGPYELHRDVFVLATLMPDRN